MLRLLIDENFDQRILRGLRLRLPQLDYVILQLAGLSGISDPNLLVRRGKKIDSGNSEPTGRSDGSKVTFVVP